VVEEGKEVDSQEGRELLIPAGGCGLGIQRHDRAHLGYSASGSGKRRLWFFSNVLASEEIDEKRGEESLATTNAAGKRGC
jgi:hypothetical protein